jgi:hypothetical protein
LTKSETEAKQVYEKAVNEKINAGYTPNTESAARIKTNDPWTTGAWVGTSGVNVFICTYYYYYSNVNSWVVEQQSFVIS